MPKRNSLKNRLKRQQIRKCKAVHTDLPSSYLSTKGTLDMLYEGPVISAHLTFPLQEHPYSASKTAKHFKAASKSSSLGIRRIKINKHNKMKLNG